MLNLSMHASDLCRMMIKDLASEGMHIQATAAKAVLTFSQFHKDAWNTWLSASWLLGKLRSCEL